MSKSTNKFDVLHVAEYFIALANSGKVPLSNKKLQKLVYYAQAWSLVLNKRTLFEDKIEAWIHGPAIRKLYGNYKDFGFNPIRKVIDRGVIELLPDADKKLLDSVWKVYGKFDAEYLEMLTHSEKPWQEARAGLQSHESSGNEISLGIMKKYYSEKLKLAQK